VVASLTIRLDLDQVARTIAGLRQAAGAAGDTSGLTDAGTAVLLEALKTEAPRKTGRLRDSILVRTEAGEQRFYALPYARFVIGGTRPHLILPRTKRALFWRGARHPVRQVRHPGTASNDFPALAVGRSTPALHGLLLDDGRRVIRLIKGDTA
jgi:hypothetical protein